jgi:hypothetical protein
LGYRPWHGPGRRVAPAPRGGGSFRGYAGGGSFRGGSGPGRGGRR